jgi:hypothetical protein
MDYAEIGDLAGRGLAVITFLVAYIYCIATYGFLLGGGVGWIPALISGAVAYFLGRYLWPLVGIGGVALGVAIWSWTH